MSERTGIEWADSTWSPWRGCTKISEGCAHCYAETLSLRNPAVLGSWGPGAPRVKNKDWRAPRGWNGRRVCPKCGIYSCADACMVCSTNTPTRRLRIFPSLCDWLDDEVPVEWLAEFLKLIYDTPNLTWLLLSKRPENFFPRLRLAVEYLDEATSSGRRDGEEHCGTLRDEPEGSKRHRLQADVASSAVAHWIRAWLGGQPPRNVWFGVSVENQKRADERIPKLLQIPAALRWLSLEPLIGPVDLVQINDGSWYDKEGANKYDATRGIAYWLQHGQYDHGLGGGPQLDWLVIGGESGAGARPCNVEWIRSLLKQGTDAGVPVFVKQLGAFPVGSDKSPTGELYACDISLRHKKGGDPAEWPEDLRVRQMPK